MQLNKLSLSSPATQKTRMDFTDVLLSARSQTPRVHTFLEVQEQAKLIYGERGQISGFLGTGELIYCQGTQRSLPGAYKCFKSCLRALTQACMCVCMCVCVRTFKNVFDLYM